MTTTSRRRYRLLIFPLLARLSSASFTISPAGSTLQQCSNVDLIWTEEPPIHLWAAPNREDAPGDPTLQDFGVINDTFTLWNVNLPVGQNVSFTYVRTAEPDSVYASSQEYTVVAGADSSCFVASSQSSSTVGNSSITSASSSTTTPGTSASTTTDSESGLGVSSIGSVDPTVNTMPTSSSASTEPTTSTGSPTTQTIQSSHSNKAYIGGIVGGVAGLVVVVCAAACFYIRRRRQTTQPLNDESEGPLAGTEGRGRPHTLTRFGVNSNPMRMSNPMTVTPFPLTARSQAVSGADPSTTPPHTDHNYTKSANPGLQGRGRPNAFTRSGIDPNPMRTSNLMIVTEFASNTRSEAVTSINRSATQPHIDHVHDKVSTSAVSSVIPSVIRESDAGITFHSDGDPIILPPAYEDRRLEVA